MKDPIITIAMPFYNSAATLELSIRSLLNQSYTDFELLLCDDGSNDQGLAIAHSFDDPRLVCWSDGRRLRLAARLNECIDRARGRYLARMDADDIAYPDRLARQLAFLETNPEIDLCSAGAMVFGKHGRPLWRFSPAQDHAGIIRSPFRGFPLWHPLWMGRIEWFRRWRYEETAWLAQDQELLLRSYRLSRFANLPEVLLGYRRERVTLKKLLRYKLLHIEYVSRQPGVAGRRLAEGCTCWLSPGRGLQPTALRCSGASNAASVIRPPKRPRQPSWQSGEAFGTCSPPGTGGRRARPLSHPSLLQDAKNKRGRA